MADEAPNWDEIPSWDNLPDDAPQQSQASPPAAQSSAPAWDQIPSWDDIPDDRPAPEGALKTAARAGAHGIVPAGAGILTSGAMGAAGGAIAGPVGAAIGGIGGLIAGSMLTSKVQETGLHAMGYDDSIQMAVNEEAHPVAAFTGEIAPFIGNPGKLAGSVVQRGIAAGGMGLFDAGQQYLQTGQVDPKRVAASTAFGAVFPHGNKATQAIHEAGANVARRAIPGRPNSASPVEEGDTGTSETPQAAPGNAREQAAPPEDVTTTGNPQSAPERSARTYPKDQETPATGNAPTEGDVDPATMAALKPEESVLNEGNAPQQPDEQIPVQTGITEAAARAPAPEAPIETGLAPPENSQTTININGKQTVVDNDLAAQREAAKRVPGWKAGTESWAMPVENARPPAAQKAIDSSLATAAKEVNRAPTEGQKEAGNYKKGHVKVDGLDITLENVRGSKRSGVDENGEPWSVKMPDHYGYLKKTEGADGDHVDVYIGKGGEKHFIVDQMDATTGKFDEHKVMMNYPSEAAAREAYGKAFSDGKAEQRLGSMREVSSEELKHWLKNGDQTEPFNLPSEPKPVAAEPVEPKVVTATVKALREKGMTQAADAIMALPADRRLAEAAKANAMLTNKTGKVPTKDLATARIRAKPPEVKVGDTVVTARTVADAELKAASLRAVKDSFDKFPPADDKVPVSVPDRQAFKTRLQDALIHAEKTLGRDPLKYKPRVPPAEWLWLREARRLVTSKTPTVKQISDFIANEKQLRSGKAEDTENVRNSKRIDADIGMSRRSGEDVVAKAENQQAQGYLDVPHEEAETMVKPEPVKTKADVERTSGKKNTNKLDMTKGEDHKKVAAILGDVSMPKSKAVEAAAERTANPVRKIEITDEAKEKAFAALKEAEAKARSRAQPGALPADEGLPAPKVKDLVDRFASDERGSLDLNAVKDSIKDHFADRPAGSKVGPKGSYAREAKTPQEEYARSLDDRLHTLKQHDTEHRVSLLKQLSSLPKELDKQAMERLYLARENGSIGSLEPKLQQLYEKHLKPLFEQNDLLFKLIRQLDPDRLGPAVENHIYRITKGEKPEYDVLHTGESNDPIAGIDTSVTTKPRGTELARKFVSLERADGKRFLISLHNDGYTIWQNYKPTRVVDPSFAFEAGKSYAVGKNAFKMGEALTPEIEKNARVGGGKASKPARYYKNAALSATLANSQLGSMARHIQFLQDLRNEPEFKALTTKSKAIADERGWQQTKMPNFKDLYMDPSLKYVMDDFARPGFNEDSLNHYRQFSQAVTKMLFWNPVAHVNNVGAHWFVERGWNWITPRGVRSLVVDGAKSIKSVINQDQLQSEIRRAGGGTLTGGVITQGFMERVGKAIGEDIERAPSKWGPIADTVGVPLAKLKDAIYRGSSRVMWAANDMFLTQAILENQRNGMTMKDAIKSAERHIPNYRVPATIIGGGQKGRFLSQLMQDPAFTAFGRYHYGVFNSFAHMAKDIAKGDGHQKLEAIGQVLALGILATVIKPAFDEAAKYVTGNKAAEVHPRGPLAPIEHGVNAIRGKEDVSSAVRGAITLPPALSTALDAYRNKDFGGRTIIEPGDVRNAAHGSAVSAGKVGVQGADFLARSLVSPYGTLSNSLHKGEGIGGTMRDQLLDIKNPSVQGSRYDATFQRKIQEQVRNRNRHPRSPAEDIYKRFFGNN